MTCVSARPGSGSFLRAAHLGVSGLPRGVSSQPRQDTRLLRAADLLLLPLHQQLQGKLIYCYYRYISNYRVSHLLLLPLHQQLQGESNYCYYRYISNYRVSHQRHVPSVAWWSCTSRAVCCLVVVYVTCRLLSVYCS